MASTSRSILKVAGICGLLAPIIAFGGIILAILSYPQFSWSNNALSDLGVVPGFTAISFNISLMASGILSLAFSAGLFLFTKESISGKIGAIIFVAVALSLFAIGLFPENMAPMHFQASFAFFMLFPLSLFFTSAEFFKSARARLAIFSFAMAIVGAAAWLLYFSTKFAPNVAIPETIAALAVAAWTFVMGYKMVVEK